MGRRIVLVGSDKYCGGTHFLNTVKRNCLIPPFLILPACLYPRYLGSGCRIQGDPGSMLGSRVLAMLLGLLQGVLKGKELALEQHSLSWKEEKTQSSTCFLLQILLQQMMP